MDRGARFGVEGQSHVVSSNHDPQEDKTHIPPPFIHIPSRKLLQQRKSTSNSMTNRSPVNMTLPCPRKGKGAVATGPTQGDTQYSPYSQVIHTPPPAPPSSTGKPQSFFTAPFKALMTLDTEQGPIQIPFDVYMARKRNATALEDQIRQMEGERDYFREIAIRLLGQPHIPARPPPQSAEPAARPTPPYEQMASNPTARRDAEALPSVKHQIIQWLNST